MRSELAFGTSVVRALLVKLTRTWQYASGRRTAQLPDADDLSTAPHLMVRPSLHRRALQQELSYFARSVHPANFHNTMGATA